MATSAHPPKDDRIFFKEARSLAKAGARVTILHSDAFPSPPDESGIEFRSFAAGGSLRRRLLTVRRLQDGIAATRPSVVHCHEPDSLWAALRVKATEPVKVLFDSHEMWGAVLAGRFPEPLWDAIQRLFQAQEERWLSRCDGAIGASWAISDYLQSVLPVERVTTILNVPVVEVFGEGGEKTWGEETLLCHDGHLTFDRGLKVIAEAVRLVAQKHLVKLKIVGDVFGRERMWLDNFVRAHGLQDVIVRTGWLPYEAVGRALAPCHIGVVAMQPLPNNRIAAPNKIFNYLLYGIPVVAPHFPFSHFKVLADEGCAMLADSSCPGAYAAAIECLIQDQQGTQAMAERALDFSRHKYRWEHMEIPLFALYERILEGSK